MRKVRRKGRLYRDGSDEDDEDDGDQSGEVHVDGWY